MNKRILISAYTGLGNFILKTPFIRKIKNLYPECKIDLLCGLPWGAEKVLANTNYINEVIWLDPKNSFLKKQIFLRNLSKKNYDLIFLPFDASPNFVVFGSNFFFRKSQIYSHTNPFQKTIKKTFLRAFFKIFLNNINWVPVTEGTHEIQLNIDLLDSSINEYKFADHKNTETIVSFKKNTISLPEKFIVCQPISRNGAPSPKNWPFSNYLELSKKIINNFKNYKLILVGDKQEGRILNSSEFNLISNVEILAGSSDFSDLCNIINGAELIIANDSAVMHIANALNKKLLALYGPTDHSRTKPLSSNAKILFSKNDSFNAMYSFKKTEDELNEEYPKDYCMGSLTVDEVYNEALKILNEKPL
tara:strand:+ start:1288 stop:2373 length:1086 start_codon:yes stop_codon:yes gene_type:complete